jgi:hypothetical protein
MARIRTIKPEFFTSSDIVSLTPLSRLLYIALWCEADREGRLNWNVKTFKLRYFPAEENCNIQDMADELIDAGLVEIYTIDGREYAEIPSFKLHQVINNRESESVIPARVKVALARVQGEGRKEGKEGKGTHVDNAFEDFYTAYPKKVGKQDALKAWDKIKPDLALQTKIMSALGAAIRSEDWRKEGGKFIPYPTTWLNGKRWEDEPGAPGLALAAVSGDRFKGYK